MSDEPIKPVLNAFLSQDSLIYATERLSGRFDNFNGSMNNSYPEGMVVKLYEDDHYIETLSDTMIYSKKYYRSSTKASGNRKYRLTLEIKGYDMVEASDIVPDRDELEIVDKNLFLTPNKYDFYDFNFNFMIRNNGTANRYYRFRVRAITHNLYVDENGDSTYYRYEAIVNLKPKNSTSGLFSDDFVDPELDGVYAVEPLSPGGQKFYALEVPDYSSFSGIGNDPTDSMFLEVSILTNDTYNYLYTYSNVSKNEGDPTAEKQNVIGNVKDGYGIVGGTATQLVLFKN